MKENEDLRLKKITSFAIIFKEAFHSLQKLDHCESTYGTGVVIHNSEMLHLEAIRELDEPYVTKLAEKFEVTKGAVSQILIKLEKKELIFKSPDPNNLSRKLIYLTDLGKKACTEHTRRHVEMEKLFIKMFEDTCTDEIDICLKLVKNLNIISKCKELNDLFMK